MPKNDDRGFSKLIGRTVASVDESAINIVTLTMDDGSVFEIDGDEQHFRIAVLWLRQTVLNDPSE